MQRRAHFTFDFLAASLLLFSLHLGCSGGGGASHDAQTDVPHAGSTDSRVDGMSDGLSGGDGAGGADAISTDVPNAAVDSTDALSDSPLGSGGAGGAEVGPTEVPNAAIDSRTDALSDGPLGSGGAEVGPTKVPDGAIIGGRVDGPPDAPPDGGGAGGADAISTDVPETTTNDGGAGGIARSDGATGQDGGTSSGGAGGGGGLGDGSGAGGGTDGGGGTGDAGSIWPGAPLSVSAAFYLQQPVPAAANSGDYTSPSMACASDGCLIAYAQTVGYRRMVVATHRERERRDPRPWLVSARAARRGGGPVRLASVLRAWSTRAVCGECRAPGTWTGSTETRPQALCIDRCRPLPSRQPCRLL
jgi:hypothetical protein